METKFNINRDKIDDKEIESRKDFDALVKKFKEQSIQDAKVRKRWPKMRKLVYTTIIAGFLVVCTVSINELTKDKSNEKTTTSVADKKTILKDKPNSKFIRPVLAASKAPYSKYTVNANTGGTIKHTTASKITVPKSAFVKKDGKEVNGTVEIHYREMHDVADQLVSGIPMRYDSAGNKQNFESAGMVDIKGFQGGEEVFIKPGKQLDIDMVSKKDGNRFNLYYLDTVAKKWNYLGKDKIVSLNEDHHTPAVTQTTAESKEEKKIQSAIEKLDESKEVVITSTDKKITSLTTPIVPKKPLAADKSRKQFKLNVNFNQYPELKAFEGCVFEVDESNTQYTKEFNSIAWSDAQISESDIKGKYYLNLSLGYRKEKLLVYPVFDGKKLEEVNTAFDKKLTEYQKALTERKAKEQKYKDDLAIELKRIETEQKALLAKLDAEKKKRAVSAAEQMYAANSGKVNETDFKVRRMFQISQFGAYNSDCAQKLASGKTTSAELVHDKYLLQPNSVYLINNADNMMYTYSYNELYNFRFDPKKEYSIIAAVNDQLYMCDKDAFKNAQSTKDKTTFTFTPLSLELFDAAELRKKLGV
ncbi:MAG: hypothetical protein Q8M29_00640 [Bacteroidota bacterium]|nr:hypothetical protein [Bacteroidota bacterium]